MKKRLNNVLLENIDFDLTYKQKEDCYNNVVTEKTQILVCDSKRKDSNYLIRLKNKCYGIHKNWNHYTITRDGIIYKHFDPKFYSDFTQSEDVNKQIITVILDNMNGLELDKTVYYNSLFETCDRENIIKCKWKSYEYWEKYPIVQIKKLVELCKYLTNKFDIDKKTLGYNYFHESTYDFNGIVSRSNYSDVELDLNPAFNFEHFEKLLNE